MEQKKIRFEVIVVEACEVTYEEFKETFGEGIPEEQLKKAFIKLSKKKAVRLNTMKECYDGDVPLDVVRDSFMEMVREMIQKS